MNMILHDMPTALIAQGNTLASPTFKDGEGLKTFDYVVANPPFSDKRWSQGVSIGKDDPYKRFEDFGTPPDKQGDYAYLLHIIRSLKSSGKGACILPHGVLFRGNAEGEIRTNLIRRGYLKAIIGLPANLFYGTGIPACILLLDKEAAAQRKGIFMVDAAQGFIKDGPKNRLRARDIHKIVDAVTRQAELPKFSRMVPHSEIEKNDFNLNLPRYIDSQEAEDLQDIEGHLKGGIPTRDVEALSRYWQVCPGLKAGLFQPLRPGYLSLVPAKAAIKPTIFGDSEFSAFTTKMNAHFTVWSSARVSQLKALQPGFHPKELIAALGESLLKHYEGLALMDPYAVYQHLLDYWDETMQDDAYLLTEGGWKAEPYRVIETKKSKDGKPGKQVDKGWACDLVPKAILVARYFAPQQAALSALEAEAEALAAQLAELEESASGEGEAFDLDKVNKAEVSKASKDPATEPEHRPLLRQWLEFAEQEAQVNKKRKEADEALDQLAYRHYRSLNEAAIQSLVVDDKWLPALASRIAGEVDRINQGLTQRVKELAERYEAPLPQMSQRVNELEAKVAAHLKRMGFEA